MTPSQQAKEAMEKAEAYAEERLARFNDIVGLLESARLDYQRARNERDAAVAYWEDYAASHSISPDATPASSPAQHPTPGGRRPEEAPAPACACFTIGHTTYHCIDHFGGTAR